MIDLSFNLTTVQLVKRVLAGSESTSNQDAAITDLIPTVSQWIDQYLSRRIERKQRTVVLDVEPGQSLFSLDAYPVTAIASIKVARDRDWPNTEALDSSTYVLHESGETGLLEIERGELVDGTGVVQLIYTGGMAADYATLLADYPAIVTAASYQVAEMWRRRDNPARSSFGDAGQHNSNPDLQLLRQVKQLVSAYRRIGVG